MVGNIHSIESFGTVDGPGIRLVIFMQGCPLRCLYCHNPDTWEYNSGKTVSVDELVNTYEKNKAFYQNGGVTVTGGEPLVQIDFVTEFFVRLKELGVHTCIDTSGVTFSNEPAVIEKFNRLIAVTDLFLLDFKHIDSDEHKKLTGKRNENIFAFAKYLCDNKKPIWARHVVVPNITLNDDYLYRLGVKLSEYNNLKALDVLPYHNLGITKYDELGINYPLADTPQASLGDANNAKEVIMSGIRDGLRKK